MLLIFCIVKVQLPVRNIASLNALGRIEVHMRITFCIKKCFVSREKRISMGSYQYKALYNKTKKSRRKVIAYTSLNYILNSNPLTTRTDLYLPNFVSFWPFLAKTKSCRNNLIVDKHLHNVISIVFFSNLGFISMTASRCFASIVLHASDELKRAVRYQRENFSWDSESLTGFYMESLFCW